METTYERTYSKEGMMDILQTAGFGLCVLEMIAAGAFIILVFARGMLR